MDTATEPQSIGNFLRQALPNLFTPISTSQKTCPKHGIEYTEEAYTRFTRGCPECAKEAEAARREREAAERAEADRQSELRRIEQRIGDSGIPKRFREKTIGGYRVGNDKQRYIVERFKVYATEFQTGHSGRCWHFWAMLAQVKPISPAPLPAMLSATATALPVLPAWPKSTASCVNPRATTAKSVRAKLSRHLAATTC